MITHASGQASPENMKAFDLGGLIVPSTRPFIAANQTLPIAAFVFSLILLSRLVIIAGIYIVTNGHEYTGDAIIWKQLAEDPFQLIFGWGTFEAQYPPLQPPLEALIYLPVEHWLGDFVALRVTSVVYEAIGAGLLMVLLARLRIERRIGILVLATLLLNPIGWVTSALWGEDETMFFALTPIILILIYERRFCAALLLTAVAVVAIKIFFLVVLLPMLVFLPWGSFVKRVAISFTPIVIAYLISFIGNMIFLGHVNFGLLAFEPDNDFAISFWSGMTVLFHWPPTSIQRPVASLLSLVAGLTLTAVVRYRTPTLRFDQLSLLMAVLLMWVLFLFYHVNPEYYVFLFSFSFVLTRTLFDFAYFTVLGFACWGVNYAFAIRNSIASPNPAHQKFVAFYLAHVPIKVEFLHPLMLVTFAALSACFAVRMTIVLWQNLNTQLDGCPRVSVALANG
jgi:hypothetical protein